MPLDGHSYLVSQGWGGKGTGLREGALSRPLTIAQKKNLAGLGKDRDEAFPFWDHLFSAAAKSIVVKCMSDDEDSAEASSSNEVTLKRTSTGILSTRRPIEGTPATSGTVTPDESAPRLSLMANAKRDAARRGLYSRFFKGPVLGPETIAAEEKRLAALVSEAFAKQNPATESVTITEHIEIKTAHDIMSVDLEVSKSYCKKRSAKVVEGSGDETEDDAAKRERKRRRMEKKWEKERMDEQHERKEKKKSKRKSKDEDDGMEAGPSVILDTTTEEPQQEKETKAERKKRREEKKRLKALRKSGESVAPHEPVLKKADVSQRPKASIDKTEKEETKLPETDTRIESKETLADKHTGEEKKKKKKRKRSSSDLE